MRDMQGIKSEEEIEASSSGGFYTPEQVAAMDPKQVGGCWWVKHSVPCPCRLDSLAK